LSLKIQILAILVNLALLAIIFFLLYKRQLREEYSLIWLLGVFTLLVLSIFRGFLIQIANFLGISYAPSLLFAVSGIFLLMIMLSFAVSITSLVRRNRDLAQRIALLEWYIKQNQLEVGEEFQEESTLVMESVDLDQENLDK
jgi:hypothetical protein